MLFTDELHGSTIGTNNCNISHWQHIPYKISFNVQLTS
jgi:hypothetical protein